MLSQITYHLPSREAYVEMIVRARATTAEILEEAQRSGDATLILLYEAELADWDRLLAQSRKGLR